jgi:hypothetical protein
MSKNTKAQAHKGNGKGCTAESRQSIDHCGEPSVRQIDETAIVLMKAHPNWGYPRCAQRARVEVYLGQAV